MSTLDPTLRRFLQESGFSSPDGEAVAEPLAGGVSSDIWRVETARGRICVKRALDRLRVAADWRAPVGRNAFEWQWIRFAALTCPGCVPQPLAHSAELGMFAMAYLEPDDHPLWKRQLLDGAVDVHFAAAVGRTLAALHSASSGRADIARQFDTTAIFHAIRIEPYLLATAVRHPDLAPRLHALAEVTATTRLALVHGDVSPKNILCGPHGPVFLDAECAWYGDPAFDLAFCLNHLLLKCVPVRERTGDLLRAFVALYEAYLGGVDWEPREQLEARAAGLLPALFLARVDGKSPVEYITREAERDLVRRSARASIVRAADRLDAVADAWGRELRAVG